MSAEEIVEIWKELRPLEILDQRTIRRLLPQLAEIALSPARKHVNLTEQAVDGAFHPHDVAEILATAGLAFIVQYGVQSLFDYSERWVRNNTIRAALFHVVQLSDQSRAAIRTVAFDLTVISLARTVANYEMTRRRRGVGGVFAGIGRAFRDGTGLSGFADGLLEYDERTFSKGVPSAANAMPLAFFLNLHRLFDVLNLKQCLAMTAEFTGENCAKVAALKSHRAHKFRSRTVSFCITHWQEFADYLDKTYPNEFWLKSEQHKSSLEKASNSASWNLWR